MSIKLHLAASLGSLIAKEQLDSITQSTIDDAFSVLMSRSDILYSNEQFDFGQPRAWPYSLEAAMRMAIAAYRVLMIDWDVCFEYEQHRIPNHIPRNFPMLVLEPIIQWILDPATFSSQEQQRLYGFIDEIILNGYLNNDYPQTPPSISRFCFGMFFLTPFQSFQPDTFLWKKYLGKVPSDHCYEAEAIANLLMDGISEQRIRQAICRELIPWCLELADPLMENGQFMERKGM